MGTFKVTESTLSRADKQLPPLRVVNGISTTTSSTITTAARENIPLTSGLPSPTGLPGQILIGQPGNSTLRWTTGLPVHHEHAEEETPGAVVLEPDLPVPPQPIRRKPIIPSLATLEKAVAARIYFENLYFPLLRHVPSREQRRIAMEKDMMNMQLNEEHKEYLRARWRKNETDYLRERRRKVDASAFVKLKTIGHGEFHSFFHIYVMWKGPNLTAFCHVFLHYRCFRRGFSCSRALYRPIICNETGT